MRIALVGGMAGAVGLAAAGGLAAAPAATGAAPAGAATVASLTGDVDGDGAPDTIALDADGKLHIRAGAGAATSDVQLAAGMTRATLAIAPVRGKPAIAVRATTATGELGYIVVRDDHGWHVGWRGELGGVGLDAEYSVELAATPAGILRYQTRPGLARCDGKPTYLFAELFDGAAFVRAAHVPVDVDPAAPKLVAKPDPDPAQPAVGYQAKWVSSEDGAEDAGALARPAALDDGDVATAWHVGSASDGDGQFVTFAARGNQHAAVQLRIVPGDHASAAALARAARPRQLAIATHAGAWRVDLPDVAHDALGTAYVVDLPPGIAGCVTVAIASTYPGSKPLAISELAVYSADERGGGRDAMLVRDVAGNADGARAEAAALAHLGAAAVPAIEAELAKTGDAGARRRLIGVLVQIHDAASAVVLARAAVAGWIEPDDAEPVASALAAAHLVHELHDLVVHHEVAPELRLAAARALDATTADGLAALIDLAGTDPRELRKVVIDRLMAAPALALVEAAKTAASPAASGDLWRAATLSARGPRGDRAAALAAMRAALPTAPDYERRYRLVDGIATLGDGEALHALVGELATVATIAPGEAAPLRQVAARAIDIAPRADALDLVLALAHDGDPGVRSGALAAIMQAPDDGRGAPWGAPATSRIDDEVARALAADTWADVRVRAAQTLGKRCQRAEPARALADAATHDAALAVRGEALAALVECRASGTAELLARTFDDDKLPLELRTRAISLAVALGDPALGRELIGRFDSWRGNALASKDAVALAVEAANAIGRLAPPGAAAALQDALDDSAFPEIVGAAAAGLGALGPGCPATAKVKLRELARSDDPQIHHPASRAAAACGR